MGRRRLLHLVDLHGRVLPPHTVPLEKGKAYSVGHVSHRKDGDYRKVSKNNWVRIRKQSDNASDEEAKKNVQTTVDFPDGTKAKLTNYPDWAISDVYDFGGHKWVAVRTYYDTVDNEGEEEVVLSDEWSFIELSTGLSAGKGSTPDEARDAAKEAAQHSANVGQVTVEEKLDQAINKTLAKEKPEPDKEFSGPYAGMPPEQEWIQFAEDVAKKYGDDDPPNWIDAQNAVIDYAAQSSTEENQTKAQVWFGRNRNNLPKELYDMVRMRTKRATLAQNLWDEIDNVAPEHKSKLYSKYGTTNEQEYINAISSWIQDRLSTDSMSEFRAFAEDFDLKELKPKGSNEMESILMDLNTQFDKDIEAYDDSTEDEYLEDEDEDAPLPSDTSISFGDTIWTLDELDDLGTWVAGEVQSTRDSTKEYDRARMNEQLLEEPEHPIARVLIENSQRHPEVQKLYRGTKNHAWQKAEPGDVLDVGIASFSHSEGVADTSFSGDVAVIEIDKSNYGNRGFLGVDVRGMIEQSYGDEEEERLIKHTGVDRHEIEKEFILRAPRLQVIDVDHDQRPSRVKCRLVDEDLLEKAVLHANNTERIIEMEKTFDYHISEEPEEEWGTE